MSDQRTTKRTIGDDVIDAVISRLWRPEERYLKTKLKPPTTKISTGHTAFDLQTKYLGHAPISAATIEGHFIYPYYDARGINQNGTFQKKDLEAFAEFNLPENVMSAVLLGATYNTIVLYVLHHTYQRYDARSRRSVRVVDCAIVTDTDGRLRGSWLLGGMQTSHKVLSGVLPYLAWVDEESDENDE